MEKKQIRSEIIALRNMMSDYDCDYLSERIKKTLISLDVYRSAENIFAYMSNKKEVYTQKIIEQAWADGKNVYIPKVLSKTEMDFYKLNSFDEVSIGMYGIEEPTSFESADEVNDAVIILPGVAFDYDLNRIGQGGGYYDRYLASHKDINFTKIALSYDFQIFKVLDVVEAHDEKLNMIVTPTMVIE